MAIPEGFLSYAWVAFAAVFVPALLGFGVVRRLGLPPTVGARASWGFAYLVGQVLLAPATAAWLWLGQPVPGVCLPALGLGVGIWCWRRSRTLHAVKRNDPREPRNVAAWGLLAVTAAACLGLLLAFLLENASPIRFGDEGQIWAAKAKALYGATAVDFRLALSIVEHADYPNLNPLTQVLAFASAGSVLHFENRLPVQAFGIALLLLLSAAGERRGAPWVAAAAVLATATTWPAANGMVAYSDIPLACATFAAVDAMLRWRETREPVYGAIASCALAAMVALKNEGSMLAAAVLVVAVVWWWCTARVASGVPRVAALPSSPKRWWLWWLLPVSTLALHRVFNRVWSLRSDLLDPALAGGRGIFARIVDQAGTHAPQVLAFFGKMFVDPATHRWLPLLCVLAAAALLLARGRAFWGHGAAFVCGVVVAGIGGYMLVFVGTHADLTWHLATAAARTTMHVVPLAALGIVMAVGKRDGG